MNWTVTMHIVCSKVLAGRTHVQPDSALAVQMGGLISSNIVERIMKFLQTSTQLYLNTPT